ncbi:hypothetical protein KSC_025480 [Ktedonobacter sp. SOSP1-52]|uniref:HAD family hydrolase n=1 Tax=Ktedonobacter sp. SOSP1-52 TaxID=2778366 RepID=UPI001915C4B5|nr:hypothetical protein [Ktedonobacter sp. SOSP1-52]GHO63656.1 hypothetical protein KSC_025480 [Ktedonobacter sp. SOSP1-52]
MKHYRCIFVDWHQTLSTSLFWEHWADPTHPLHSLHAPVVSSMFNSGNTSETIAWMRGELPVEELLQRICLRHHFDYELILQELTVSCKAMQFVSPTVPRSIAQLRAAGIRVAIATDNMDTFTRWTVPALKLHELVDDILNSFDLRALKGDLDSSGRSLFFADYLEKHALEPGESILLDDNYEEDFAALIRSFGIDYHPIVPGVGLISALEILVEGMTSHFFQV